MLDSLGRRTADSSGALGVELRRAGRRASSLHLGAIHQATIENAFDCAIALVLDQDAIQKRTSFGELSIAFRQGWRDYESQMTHIAKRTRYNQNDTDGFNGDYYHNTETVA